ncbi:MAG: arsenic efflux protein, partial [Clostridia bacterium]|nr:arsenic efflux protein [Clostridia bacterium]
MEEIIHIVKHTIEHGIKLLPFLFITYLIMEYIEHKTGDKTKKIIKKSGKFGPLLGGILGIFPQCGFSAAASNLYAGKIITLGTLIAIFLSTSDEMLPILISESAPIQTILLILGIKLVIGIIAGFTIDLFIQLYNKKVKNKKKESDEEELEEEIGHMCEHEHCHCDEGGILKSAIKHTLSIFLFIIL